MEIRQHFFPVRSTPSISPKQQATAASPVITPVSAESVTLSAPISRPRSSILRKMSATTALIACLGTTGLAGVAPGINESMEKALLGGNNRPGKMVEVVKGHKGTTFAVHGIKGSPEVIQPLIDKASSRGRSVEAFVYDDTHRRLGDSSHDLADQIATWMHKNPGKKLAKVPLKPTRSQQLTVCGLSTSSWSGANLS